MSKVAILHVICLGLVALDFVARTWRTQLFLSALRRPLSFREVFVQSAIGETASSLTPLRAGGEPARVWAMGRQGIPAGVSVVCIGLELVATSAVIVAAGIVLGFTIGEEWWATAGPGLLRSIARNWPWVAAIGAATLIVWEVARRLRPEWLNAIREELAAARGHMRDIPVRVYLANVPVSLLNIGARVAILPALALTLDHPPPLVATVVGSFALLYAQAFIPTPAGAGAVDLGFLGGAAGNFGSAETELLAWWRVYTVVVGATLGVVLTVWRFHANIFAVVRSARRAE